MFQVRPNEPGSCFCRPSDWPGSEPIELVVHDRPHESSTTEWWYLNGHIECGTGRRISLFASFFSSVFRAEGWDFDNRRVYALIWALTDVDGKRYLSESWVDRHAPQIGLHRIESGRGPRDQRLLRAIREVLERGAVPLPDRMFQGQVVVRADRLALDFAGNSLMRSDAGTYHLKILSQDGENGCDLVFRALKGPIRHGQDGIVLGVGGERMFYYFLPRCEVTGTVLVDGQWLEIDRGSGWYDHEFGVRPDESTEESTLAWLWVGVQLDDGSDLSVAVVIDVGRESVAETYAVWVAADGTRRQYSSFRFEPVARWRSLRTFVDYETEWDLHIPAAELALHLRAEFPDQEFITLLMRPAFWEGRVTASGTRGGAPVTGLGYFERCGFPTLETIDEFFVKVGEATRASVERLAPISPTYEQARALVASEERDAHMDGVDIPLFASSMIKPVRAIIDRGGKAWRSFAVIGCCEVVGGDSRPFCDWLAVPEFLHVGSLIIDDIEDGSSIRRGGPSCHEMFGVPLAINAGTACYFMGQKILSSSDFISPAARLRVYDEYFAALRAGHAGQALDLAGLGRYMDGAVASGDGHSIERRVLAIHRLKTAVPASSLAKIGAIAGGGSAVQIEAVGQLFESLGLAFQIIDDVLNLRGFEGGLKTTGEDISLGKVTLPVARGLSMMSQRGRRWLWDTLRSQPEDPRVVARVVAELEACGAIASCERFAAEIVEKAWVSFDPTVEESRAKILLRAFGWYVLERHY